MHRIGSVAAAAIAVLTVVIAPANSESPNDQAVLSGLSEVKVAFDVLEALQTFEGQTRLATFGGPAS